MRQTLLLVVLFLSSWETVAALSADEPQAATPFHDLARLLQESPSGAIEVPSRRDVLLLKVYDGDPALGREAQRGMLLREVVRQAFLLAAREELGLPTRDQTLREAFPEADEGEASATGSPEGSIQIVSSIPGLFPNFTALRVSVFREQSRTGELLWEQQIKYPKSWWNALEMFTTELEQWSRNEFVTVLNNAGFEGKANRWLDSGSVPEDVLSRASQWNMVSQYFAVRSLHRLIREDGESPERLAALAEAYARLGTLTAWHWSPVHQAFKARAFLYSQRLMVRSNGSPLGQASRAYVLALMGLHHDALAAFKDQGVELSGTSQVVDAFCRFQEDRLMALAEQPELRPLARYLRFLAVEPFMNHNAVTPAANALLEEHPDCFQAIHSLATRGVLGGRLGAARQAVMMHAPALYSRLSREAELPPNALELIKGGVGQLADVPTLDAQQLENRRELIAAFRESGAIDNDQVEPSLACFAQLVLDEGFSVAAREAHNQRYSLGLRFEQMADVIHELSPLLEGHPYEEGIRSYGRSPGENQQRTPEFVAAIGPAEFETTLLPLAQALTEHHRPAWDEFLVPMVDHLDMVYRDLVYQIEKGLDWGGNNAAEQLARISPHGPMRAVGLLRFRWNVAEVAEQAGIFEEKFGSDAEVLEELGRRYREVENWEGAERVLTRLVMVQPSYNAYMALAALYSQQQKREKWLETLKAFLQTPELGLSHSRVRADIAKHYMARGEYQAALPYAEEAAQSWALSAMATAVHCHEAMGNVDKAEVWIRRLSQRYDSAALEWYFLCRRTGVGDVRAAREFAESFVQSLGSPLPPKDQLRVAIYELISGDADEALAKMRQLYEQTKGPFYGLHAALIAHQLQQPELHDTLLQQITQQGTNPPVEAEDAPTVQLATLLHGALKPGEQPQLDRDAVDELIRSAPPGVPTNLNYFVGKFLWLHQQNELAEVYLRMAARSPQRKFNRELAGALLRDHRVDLEAMSPKEPRPEQR